MPCRATVLRLLSVAAALLPGAPSFAQFGPPPAFSPQGEWEVAVVARLDGVGRIDGMGVLAFGPFGVADNVVGEAIVRRMMGIAAIDGDWDAPGNARRIVGSLEVDFGGVEVAMDFRAHVRQGRSLRLRGRRPDEGVRSFTMRGRRFDPAQVPDYAGDYDGSIALGAAAGTMTATFAAPAPKLLGDPAPAPVFDVTASTESVGSDGPVSWEGHGIIDTRGDFMLSLSELAGGFETGDFISVRGRWRAPRPFRASGRFFESVGEGGAFRQYGVRIRLRPSTGP